MSVETMKQALDALNNTDTHPLSSAEQYFKEMNAMEALEDAIADADEVNVDWEAVAADQALTIAMLKQREWQGLTNDEITEIDQGLDARSYSMFAYTRAIEAKLKEKNT
jgi:asparagine synthetase A